MRILYGGFGSIVTLFSASYYGFCLRRVRVDNQRLFGWKTSEEERSIVLFGQLETTRSEAALDCKGKGFDRLFFSGMWPTIIFNNKSMKIAIVCWGQTSFLEAGKKFGDMNKQAWCQLFETGSQMDLSCARRTCKQIDDVAIGIECNRPVFQSFVPFR